MSNFTKENPIGLDVVIDAIQRKIYGLKDVWNVDLNGYSRCQILKNQEGNKTIEFYLGKGEYTGSLINAENNKFFFLANEAVENVNENFYTTKIELYFMINLQEIYPEINHRADEEVRVDVLNLINEIDSVKVDKIEFSSDKVFGRFNNRISQNYEYEYTDDMQPYHYFKVLINVLEYKIDQRKCN